MELIEKVKKALIDSGFPLEMRIAKILQEDDWGISVGRRYEDFETGVLREIDISANKLINGIEVHLTIECKKSDNKQLVLYAPTHNRKPPKLFNPFRYFPQPAKKKDYRLAKKLHELWKNIPVMNEAIPLSNNIIFTKGDKIEQNNDAFFNSLNGIIKYSIINGSDGYIETDFRMMFFHLLIYDGMIYQVTSSSDDDFDIKETQYGHYEFPYTFKFPVNALSDCPDIVEAAKYYIPSNTIEIVHSDYFKKYIQRITDEINTIPSNEYEGWGDSIADFRARMEESIEKTKKVTKSNK